MSQYQSANSLQNSIPTISFTKSDRFGSLYRKPHNSNIGKSITTISNRSTTQGFGKKWNFVDSVKNTPAPNTYNLPELQINPKKGKTILSKIPKKVNKIYINIDK